MKNPSDKIKDFIDRITKSEKDMMENSGKMAKEFFLESFSKKGWEDSNFEAWDETKIENKIGSLLDRTGRLKNSIKINNVTSKSVEVSSDESYARYVNDGTSRMNARKFMGSSNELKESIIKSVKEEINKIFNQ